MEEAARSTACAQPDLTRKPKAAGAGFVLGWEATSRDYLIFWRGGEADVETQAGSEGPFSFLVHVEAGTFA